MTKTILITGTSSGFGRDTAEKLARDGYRVFAAMRDIAGRNRRHADALRSQKIGVVELDVTDDGSIDRAVASILAEAGKISVLVNNAGIASVGVTEAFTADQAKAIFDTNVIGLLRVTRAVLPSMRQKRDGLIINIGSIFGRVTFPFVGIYGASKMAVEALTDSIRLEVSQLGVEVVEVQPGAYPTNMYSSIQMPADGDITKSYGEVGQIPEAMFKTFMSMFQAKDAPKPYDIAEAVAKLVGQAKGSRAARTVVGKAYGVDKINADVAPVQKAVVGGLARMSHTTAA
jgi:NADP-dependent 3-hydroxy acid dehydrogenase YdfG